MTARLMFSIKPDRMNQATRQYAAELRSRMQAVRRKFVQEAAASLLNTVSEKLPSDPLFDDLRKALVVCDVTGLDEDEAASAVMTKATIVKRKLRELPQDRVLLVVQKPNRRVQPPPEEIFLLRAHNPWTIDTIPFIPKEATARVSYRVVTVEEVERVREMRRVSLTTLVPELVKRGLRFTAADRQRMMNEKAESDAVADLVLASLRAEYGLKGYPNAPHWRPGIRGVKDEGFARRFFGQREIEDALCSVDSQAWRKLGVGGMEVGSRRAEALQEFQEKVKVR